MWGGGGEVQLKCGDGRKLLTWSLWGAPLSEGRAPFRGARPYCLLDWHGAQAPLGGLGIFSSSLMQLRVDEN
jgi:hypothetical protein